MSEYTKGPWKYDNYGSGITGVGFGGSENRKEEFKIADIRGWGHLQYLGNDKAIAIQEANAHLISAAPEMYEALKNVQDEIKGQLEVGLLENESFKTRFIGDRFVSL